MVIPLPKINVLEKHVAELIAAGEVVERPSSVVKELVENSIDAGSTEVTVEIQNGGNTFIRVTDNGCGIGCEDLPRAFLRHATSKISTENDLCSINTFGFRGEALASIAAVSHVTVLTRTAESPIGYCIEATDCEIGEPSEAGCPVGTTIVVRDLFYNTPARQKFLKKDVTEANAVSNLMDKIALSHPEIKFRFIRDGETKLATYGNGDLVPVIASVYGRDFASSLLEVNYSDMNNPLLRLHGYVTKPVASKASRSYQNFYVNTRFVKTNTAMAAVEEAFRGSSMIGKYPGCVLFIDIPPEIVDVNVHPAKIEVRFQNEKDIFDLVYYGVKSALNEKDHSAVVEETKKAATWENYTEKGNADIYRIPKQESFVEIKAKDFTSVLNRIEDEKPVFRPNYVPEGTRRDAETKIETLAVRMTADTVQDNSVREEDSEANLRFLGEAFKTYIILESDDGLVFVDKHAAHERILYEKLKNGVKAFACQMLLAPVTVALTDDQCEILLNNSEKLELLGFLVEDFGNSTLLIRALPFWVKPSDASNILCEISDSMLANRHDITPEKLNHLYANIACRAAIKANDRNYENELNIIIEELVKNPDIKYCPHGRPITVEITRTKLEHMFGRIQ